MDNILNFRKLADGEVNNEGKQIKGIYRSADPSFASLFDQEQLIKLGVKNIIDLRSEEEISVHPQVANDNLTVKWIDIIGNGAQNKVENFDVEELSQLMVDLYKIEFVTTNGFKEEFKYINSINGDGFLFHCTAGKDRTGITGVILMHILGFNKQQITNEYLTIDEKLVDLIIKRFLGVIEVVDDKQYEQIRSIASVRQEYLDRFYEAVESNYGSLDNFIKQKLQITDEMKNKMRANYLV